MISDRVGVVNFPTLADLQDAWIEQHCRVPDGFLRGRPFRPYDWQFWCRANFYRVRDDAVWLPDRPLMAQAFTYRRALIVGPQKCGKGPDDACYAAVEAAGPAIFGGWAKRGDTYECEEFGCGCGWFFRYEAGDPKGIRHPSPLIQLTATSEDQVEQNIFRHLKAMIRLGPLGKLLVVREGFVKIRGQNDDPDLDRIDVVTASAMSRLGNPISFAVQDESGLYTAQNGLWKVARTQRRGAAGMGGRIIETSNAWDPAEASIAQATYESGTQDIFRFFRQAPADLLYSFKRDRRKIHAIVYDGCEHINLDSIEAEAAEAIEKDPAEAERFFGNRIVAGGGSWLKLGLWESRHADAMAS